MAENSTYIQWNLPNWITITIMAAFGLMLFGVVQATIRQYAARGA